VIGKNRVQVFAVTGLEPAAQHVRAIDLMYRRAGSAPFITSDMIDLGVKRVKSAITAALKAGVLATSDTQAASPKTGRPVTVYYFARKP